VTATSDGVCCCPATVDRPEIRWDTVCDSTSADFDFMTDRGVLQPAIDKPAAWPALESVSSGIRTGSEIPSMSSWLTEGSTVSRRYSASTDTPMVSVSVFELPDNENQALSTTLRASCTDRVSARLLDRDHRKSRGRRKITVSRRSFFDSLFHQSLEWTAFRDGVSQGMPRFRKQSTI